MTRVLPLILLAGCGTEQKVGVYNSPPVVSISLPVDGASVDEGTLVTFEARVEDGQTPSEALEIQWSSDIDGVFPNALPADSTGLATYVTSSLSVGNHAITLNVTDEGAERASDSIVLTVVEVPDAPEIAIVHPAGGESAIEGEAFNFVAMVSDLQDAPEDLSVSFQSDLDGEFCTDSPDAVGIAECEYALTPGDHRLVFTVTDTTGLMASAEWLFVVVSGSTIDDDGDGFTEDQGDCDDTTSASYPGGAELEDGADNDCDGTVDEGTPAYDDDGDGWSENAGDCDDADAGLSPDAIETCNGYDDDCDGTADEEDAEYCQMYYYDYDGDGFGSASVSGRCLCTYDGDYSAPDATDCYDYDAEANTSATTYKSYARPDGSYDWNCDGSETKYYTDIGECSGAVYVCVTEETGWSGSVPACGATGSWITGCDNGFLDCYEETTSLTQACL